MADSSMSEDDEAHSESEPNEGATLDEMVQDIPLKVMVTCRVSTGRTAAIKTAYEPVLRELLEFEVEDIPKFASGKVVCYGTVGADGITPFRDYRQRYSVEAEEKRGNVLNNAPHNDDDEEYHVRMTHAFGAIIRKLQRKEAEEAYKEFQFKVRKAQGTANDKAEMDTDAKQDEELHEEQRNDGSVINTFASGSVVPPEGESWVEDWIRSM